MYLKNILDYVISSKLTMFVSNILHLHELFYIHLFCYGLTSKLLLERQLHFDAERVGLQANLLLTIGHRPNVGYPMSMYEHADWTE